jgi:hypothetical protein
MITAVISHLLGQALGVGLQHRACLGVLTGEPIPPAERKDHLMSQLFTTEAAPDSIQPAPESERGDDRRATVSRFLAAIQAGDYAALQDVLTPDAITRWPQSSERLTGAMSCVRVYQNYPGGPPNYRVQRISGAGDLWVAELSADYGTDRWYIVSVMQFEGPRIARMTDYFGPSYPAPEWRKEWVDLEAGDQTSTGTG